MKTLNSLSGGKTSSYLAVHYPADYNIFSLVRTNDPGCLFPDEKIRQIVSDKIGQEFIGTLEMDEIIYTMLDLEQFIGKEITWVTGKTFDEIIVKPSGKVYLPNPTQRFCTSELKLRPIFDWWYQNINEPIEQRLGFRASENKRAVKMQNKLNEDGLLTFKGIIGKHENGNNKWKELAWNSPSFPLIEDRIFKDTIEKYWLGKPVRFAYMNNCVGCFHRNPILLKHMSHKEPGKFQWFLDKEELSYGRRTWRKEFTYANVKKSKLQFDLFDDDFNECDSGYCGL
jgi:hypothetical protein